MKSPGASLRFIKNVFRQAKGDLGNSLYRFDKVSEIFYKTVGVNLGMEH